MINHASLYTNHICLSTSVFMLFMPAYTRFKSYDSGPCLLSELYQDVVELDIVSIRLEEMSWLQNQ